MSSSKDDLLGPYIDQARKASGYTFRALARVSGIPMTTIVRICHSQVHMPRPQHLVVLARELELPLAEVFDRAGLQLPSGSSQPALASLDAHLRAEYELTDWELAEARNSIARIIEQHHARQKRIQANNNQKPSKGGTP